MTKATDSANLGETFSDIKGLAFQPGHNNSATKQSYFSQQLKKLEMFPQHAVTAHIFVDFEFPDKVENKNMVMG